MALDVAGAVEWVGVRKEEGWGRHGKNIRTTDDDDHEDGGVRGLGGEKGKIAETRLEAGQGGGGCGPYFCRAGCKTQMQNATMKDTDDGGGR